MIEVMRYFVQILCLNSFNASCILLAYRGLTFAIQKAKVKSNLTDVQQSLITFICLSWRTHRFIFRYRGSH